MAPMVKLEDETQTAILAASFCFEGSAVMSRTVQEHRTFALGKPHKVARIKELAKFVPQPRRKRKLFTPVVVLDAVYGVTQQLTDDELDGFEGL